MVNLLNKNPQKAIPIIVERLKKRAESMADAKIECQKSWKEVCEKNFMKSLDHRSFHFKNHERKNQN
jgi:paired amphipathic helix protein Sin3a